MKRLLFLTHSSTMYGGAEDEFERLLKYFSDKKKYFIEGIFPVGERNSIYASYCNRWGNYKSGTFPEIYIGIWKIVKYFIISFIQIRNIINFTKNRTYDAAIINVSVLVAPIILLKFKKIKSVVFIRESINIRFLRYVIYKLINSKCNWYVGVSKKNENDFKEISKNINTLTLYSTIENFEIDPQNILKLKELLGIRLFNKIEQKEAFPIFSVAPICQRKNQKLLVETLKLMVESNPKFIPYVILIGQKTNDEKYSCEVEVLIKKYNLQNNCFLLGPLNKNILYSLYKYAKTIVITSKSEGLPLVMAEAFKYKIPLITTNVGGLNEFISEGVSGYFIENDPHSLMEKLMLVWNDRAATEKIKERSFELYKENLDLDKNFNRLNDLIIKITGE